MTAATTPATDEQIAAWERYIRDDTFQSGLPFAHALQLIARIHQEREKAIRECAELALAMPKLRQLSPDHVAANSPQDVALEILALLPTPPALSQEELT